VFDRLLAELDGFNGRPPRSGADLASADDAGPGGGPEDLPQLRAAVARTIDIYADLFRRTLEVYADVVESVLRTGAPAAPATNGNAAEVGLAAAPGHDAVATVWIHNTTETPVDVVLRITDLTAHDGARIEGSAATFAPGRLHVDGGESRSAALSVRVPRAVAPGTYVGHVLATGLPGTTLAVRLVVAS
jgi:hypothetical protein